MMKKLVYAIFFMVLLGACKETPNVENATESMSNPQPAVGESSIKGNLQNLTPLTSEELEAAFPKQLYDLKLDKAPFINNQTIVGHFGGRKITLTISDAAGENYRSATYILDALNDNGFVDTHETKYIKKVRKGIPTFARYYVGSHTELDFLYKDRFQIKLMGEMEPDALWEAFDINELKRL